mmetsp:Transcript_32286/g.81313  ORF Transcript_32286/g.81313 Transcript_32286/m.81313 type:complete len:214 (+) Transcript_32286:90-731(+)
MHMCHWRGLFESFPNHPARAFADRKLLSSPRTHWRICPAVCVPLPSPLHPTHPHIQPPHPPTTGEIPERCPLVPDDCQGLRVEGKFLIHPSFSGWGGVMVVPLVDVAKPYFLAAANSSISSSLYACCTCLSSSVAFLAFCSRTSCRLFSLSDMSLRIAARRGGFPLFVAIPLTSSRANIACPTDLSCPKPLTLSILSHRGHPPPWQVWQARWT